MAVDVFISYPRRDRVLVEPIKAKLALLGLSVFFDTEGIDGGQEFPDVINGAVKTAGVVLGCWSPYAFTRRWVRLECRVGQLRNVLIPVAIAPFTELDVHLDFLDCHYYDLSDFNGNDGHPGWVATLAAIEKKLERSISRQVGTGAQLLSVREDASNLSGGERAARAWITAARGSRPTKFVSDGGPTEHLPDIPEDVDQAYLADRIHQLDDDGEADFPSRPEIRHDFPMLGGDYVPAAHALAANSPKKGRIVRCVKPGWCAYWRGNEVGRGRPVVVLG